MKKLLIMCLIWMLMGSLADVYRGHPGCLPPPPPPRWAYAGTLEPMNITGPITVTGKLCRIMMIGGETTGWYIELNKCISITSPIDPLPKGFGVVGRNKHTITLDRIEIDYAWPKQLIAWEGKEVKVTGFLKRKSGVERGPYYYIIVGDLQTWIDTEWQRAQPWKWVTK
jgi:hypothetical protein